jgi:hypothetical protein
MLGRFVRRSRLALAGWSSVGALHIEPRRRRPTETARALQYPVDFAAAVPQQI